MRENEGHLLVQVAGMPFQSCCVKCGTLVDWYKVRSGEVVIPLCSYRYTTKANQDNQDIPSES